MRISNCSSDEYDFFKPTAPPPSPQEPSMLDMIFKDKSHITFEKERGYTEHAHTLDHLLRRTLQNKIGKRKRAPWSFEKQHKLKAIMKVATENKLKRAFVIDEETSRMIHELRDMGL
ncbi:unnamed protein product [Rhizopus stolonifer]